jgi:hypothetical protein
MSSADEHQFRVPMLLPGIEIDPSPTDFAPIKQIQMAGFDSQHRRLFRSPISGPAPT